MTVHEFQDLYPTREQKEEAVRQLSDEEISEIINSCDNFYGKKFYSSLRMKNHIRRYSVRYNEITGKALQYFAESKAGENIVISPFSILTLLAIVAESVDGDSLNEILEAICGGFPYEMFQEVITELNWILTNPVTNVTEDGEYMTGDSVVSSSAVIIQKRLKESLVPVYEDILYEYGGKLFASDNIVQDINVWVEKSTRGMICDIADESMSDALACLINAIAFEADWGSQYEEEDIDEGTFRNADGTESDVQMMCSTENLYIEDKDFTGFLKPYKNNEFLFMALLPKKQGNRAFLRAINRMNLKVLFETALPGFDIDVMIPEFSFTFDDDMIGFCKNEGIKTIFTPDADFSPMTAEWLMLDSIIHKAHIEVDRRGTKAAAATAAFIATGCAPVERFYSVHLDRPFVYAIFHNDTGIPIFAGVMNRAEYRV